MTFDALRRGGWVPETVGSVTSVTFALLRQTNSCEWLLTLMKRFLAAMFLVLFSGLMFTPILFAQQDQTETTCRLVNCVTSQYPEMARSTQCEVGSGSNACQESSKNCRK